MKKPFIEWVDPDPAKKILGCTVIAIMLLCVALFHFTVEDWASPRSLPFYIVPIFLLVPMLGQYLVWQRKGVKKPKITLSPEGFCIGNRSALFSLNAEGKRKWGKPHLYLWEDIQLITLDDEDPHANVFSWTLKPEVTTPDAPQNFFFGQYRSQVGKPWDLNATDALELMVQLLVADQQEDRKRCLARFRANA